jgi:hypothetical protein
VTDHTLKMTLLALVWSVGIGLFARAIHIVTHTHPPPR